MIDGILRLRIKRIDIYLPAIKEDRIDTGMEGTGDIGVVMVADGHAPGVRDEGGVAATLRDHLRHGLTETLNDEGVAVNLAVGILLPYLVIRLVVSLAKGIEGGHDLLPLPFVEEFPQGNHAVAVGVVERVIKIDEQVVIMLIHLFFRITYLAVHNQIILFAEPECLFQDIGIHGGARHGVQSESRADETDVLRYITAVDGTHAAGGSSGEIAKLTMVAHEYQRDGSRGGESLTAGDGAAQVSLADWLELILFRQIEISAVLADDKDLDVLGVDGGGHRQFPALRPVDAAGRPQYPICL